MNNSQKNESPSDSGEKLKQPITFCLVSAAFFGALGSSFLFGYNVSVVNAPFTYVQDLYNTTWYERYGEHVAAETSSLLWSFTVSMLAVGGFVGVWSAPFINRKLGRKGTLLLNNIFAIAAALLLSLGERARSFEMLLIGRLVMGVDCGISLSVLPMYLGEISPRQIRGTIGQFHSILVSLGVFTGQVMGLPELLRHEERWNYLFAFVALPAVVQLSVLPFSPESPRYLLMERKDEVGAEKAFQRFLGRMDVSREMKEVLAEAQSQSNMRTTSVIQVLRNPAIRWQLITIVTIMACYQLSGINAIMYYTSRILRKAGFAEDILPYITLSTGGIQVVCSILSSIVIERVGRKSLIIFGFSSMAVFYALLTVCLHFQNTVSWLSYLSFICILGVIGSFCCGPGGIPFILAGELFEQSNRAPAVMIAGSVIWLSNFSVSLLFPLIQEKLQSFVFLVFLAICLFVSVYLYFILPETKNKTFMEISQSFARINKIPLPSPSHEIKIDLSNTPDVNGQTVKSEVNGQTVTPEVNGQTVTPEVNGQTVTPEVNGQTVTLDMNKQTVTPEVNRQTVTPEVN